MIEILGLLRGLISIIFCVRHQLFLATLPQTIFQNQNLIPHYWISFLMDLFPPSDKEFNLSFARMDSTIKDIFLCKTCPLFITYQGIGLNTINPSRSGQNNHQFLRRIVRDKCSHVSNARICCMPRHHCIL